MKSSSSILQRQGVPYSRILPNSLSCLTFHSLKFGEGHILLNCKIWAYLKIISGSCTINQLGEVKLNLFLTYTFFIFAPPHTIIVRITWKLLDGFRLFHMYKLYIRLWASQAWQPNLKVAVQLQLSMVRLHKASILNTLPTSYEGLEKSMLDTSLTPIYWWWANYQLIMLLIFNY